MKSANLENASKIVDRLYEHSLSELFRKPAIDMLDPIDQNRYNSMIHSPIDLGTVRNNLNNHYYKNTQEWCDDMRRVFDNAIKFDESSTYITGIARYLKSKFEKQYKDLRMTKGKQYHTLNLLHANFVEVMSHAPTSINTTVPTVEHLPAGYERSVAQILVEKLNQISDEPNAISKVREIIGSDSIHVERDNTANIDIGALTPEKRDELWKLVRKVETASQ